MGKAIGMVELSSIARGIETSDFMVKAAQVDLIRSSTVCPGKYIIIVGGDTGDVKAAMEEGLAKGGAYVVDSLRISNVHEQLIPALTGTVAVESPGAVGVLEFYSVASAILAADEAGQGGEHHVNRSAYRLCHWRKGFCNSDRRCRCSTGCRGSSKTG